MSEIGDEPVEGWRGLINLAMTFVKTRQIVGNLFPYMEVTHHSLSQPASLRLCSIISGQLQQKYLLILGIS